MPADVNIIYSGDLDNNYIIPTYILGIIIGLSSISLILVIILIYNYCIFKK